MGSLGAVLEFFSQWNLEFCDYYGIIYDCIWRTAVLKVLFIGNMEFIRGWRHGFVLQCGSVSWSLEIPGVFINVIMSII